MLPHLLGIHRPNGSEVLCSFVRARTPSTATLSETSCEESVVRLLSFTMGSAIESLQYQGHYRHGGDVYQPRFDT